MDAQTSKLNLLLNWLEHMSGPARPCRIGAVWIGSCEGDVAQCVQKQTPTSVKVHQRVYRNKNTVSLLLPALHNRFFIG